MGYKGLEKFGGVICSIYQLKVLVVKKKLFFVPLLRLNKTMCLEDKPHLTRKSIRTDPRPQGIAIR